jgi:diguanylate cyclase (GGDEF)-like protein/PAS domain S-box-containing protein
MPKDGTSTWTVRRQASGAGEATADRIERLGGLGEWEWDLGQRRGRWSSGMYRLLGLPPGSGEPSYPRLLELVHGDDRGRAEAAIEDAAGSGAAWSLERRIVRPDGAERVLYGRGEVAAGGRKGPTIFAVEQDITERFGAIEFELRAAEERYRRLVERLPAVSYVAEPGADGVWHYVSPQIESLLGYSPREWLADRMLWARRIHPDDRARVIAEEERDAATGGPVATEYRMIARDGREVWIRDEAVLRARQDGREAYDGLLSDVTERKLFEARLQLLADHDPLTGVLNRRRFIQDLEFELKILRRHDLRSALMIIDLDNFKEVNDSRGHLAGDAMLRQLASVLQARLRETDTIGRLGGDEFAVLLRGAGAPEAAGVAEQLLAAIRRRAHGRGGHSVTASAGLAELGAAGTATRALAAADAAMYAAKRRGGDRAIVADGEREAEAVVAQPSPG